MHTNNSRKYWRNTATKLLVDFISTIMDNVLYHIKFYINILYIHILHYSIL